MRLKVFDTIDEALALLSENNEFYHEIEREIEQYLIAVFKESSEMIIDINSRVKSRESLREKIIRNRFYVENDSAQGVLGIGLHSLIMSLAELDTVMFGRNIEKLSFLYAVAITMVFAIIVNLVMYRKLKKIPMVESLKSVE